MGISDSGAEAPVTAEPGIAGTTAPWDQGMDRRLRWVHWLCLILCLSAGVWMRWHWIAHESLWLDEYWSVYLATGRGQAGSSIYDVPTGVLIDPAPEVGFTGAPPWWKVWTGMSSAIHPPLYHIVLRWWIDLFGDSDLATRSLSASLDLASAALLFWIIRRTRGPWPGVFAAGLLCFSCAHLDQSQETRSYTLSVFLCLCAAAAILSIEARGATRWRLFSLALAMLACMLTHYFCAMPLLAIAIYALVRLRGGDRKLTLAAIFADVVVFAVAWGPMLFRTRGQFSHQTEFLLVPRAQLYSTVWHNAIWLPMRLVFSSYLWMAMPIAALAVLVYLLSPLQFRIGKRDALLWWMWMMLVILLDVGADLTRSSQTLSLLRYSFLASPAIYALLADPALPGILGRFVAPLLVVGALSFAVERTTGGPPIKPQFAAMAADIDQLGGPREVIVFTKSMQYDSRNTYLAVRHYMPDFNHPVVFLQDRPPTDPTLQRLSRENRLWMIGTDVASQTRDWMPGFAADSSMIRSIPEKLLLWRIVPDHSPVMASPTSSPTSHPEHQ